ncbi:hypothetical protein L6452_06593 [Arctium lappa]|uniref:Uncharacterized protein n=1 Tax=Arctium lappa TaxID=4217 RepID=A0ACB9EK51_ARCLA|nr:hypothetical protein L6452_06593 [Arctium lappa]
MEERKENNTKCELEKKIDLLVKERIVYSSKVNELEKIISMVVVTEHKTPESIIHSPGDDSADSECSFNCQGGVGEEWFLSKSTQDPDINVNNGF